MSSLLTAASLSDGRRGRSSRGGLFRCFTSAALLCALLVGPALAVESDPSTPTDTEASAPADTEASIIKENEYSDIGEPVVPPGQEELLAAMLGKGAALPDGCELASGEVDYKVVKATYTCSGSEVVFTLTHPSQASATATVTKRFALSLESGSPPADLAGTLESLIRSREAAFEWQTQSAPPGLISRTYVVIAIGSLLGIAVLGWALRRRRS